MEKLPCNCILMKKLCLERQWEEWWKCNWENLNQILAYLNRNHVWNTINSHCCCALLQKPDLIKTGILSKNSNPLFCDSPVYFGLILTLYSLQSVFDLLAFASGLYFLQQPFAGETHPSSTSPAPGAASPSCSKEPLPKVNKYRKMPMRGIKWNSAQQKLTPEENLISAMRNVSKHQFIIPVHG